MSEQYKVNIVQKKIITSLLYDSYHILITTFARIYTCEINSEYWLYTGLQGALVFCYKVDAKPYLLKFFLFDLKTFETLFECELYKKFDKAFKKGTERFFYFEINNGFIGIEIPNFDEANTFYARVLTAKDDYLKDVLKEFKPLKGDELKEKGKKMIHKLDKQFKDKENITNKMARTEIILTIGKLEKEINTVDLDEDSGKLIINGTGYEGIENDLLKIGGLNLELKNNLKVGNSETFSRYLSRNILRSYMKGLIIPKRKINRGEGIKVEKIEIEENKYENNNIINNNNNEEEREEYRYK